MKKITISLICLSSLSLFSQSSVAESQAADFNGKHLFTHSFNLKIKEYNDVISPCFKLNSKALKVLKSYESCVKSGGRDAPLHEAIGSCSRGDKASVYFFDSKTSCELARKETLEGAST